MMRVRIFAGGTPAAVAEQINDWFEKEAGSAHIAKTETVVGPAVDRYGPYPCVVITIWYEPESDCKPAARGLETLADPHAPTPLFAVRS